MHQLFVSCVVLVRLLGSVAAFQSYGGGSYYPGDVVDVDHERLLELQAEAGDAVQEYLVDRPRGECTAENLSIRKEW